MSNANDNGPRSLNRPVTVDEQGFSQFVLRAQKPVLVEFFVPAHAATKAMKPVLEDIAKNRADLMVARVDITANQPLAMTYGAIGTPVVLLFNQGKVYRRIAGQMPATDLLRQVDASLGYRLPVPPAKRNSPHSFGFTGAKTSTATTTKTAAKPKRKIRVTMPRPTMKNAFTAASYGLAGVQVAGGIALAAMTSLYGPFAWMGLGLAAERGYRIYKIANRDKQTQAQKQQALTRLFERAAKPSHLLTRLAYNSFVTLTGMSMSFMSLGLTGFNASLLLMAGAVTTLRGVGSMMQVSWAMTRVGRDNDTQENPQKRAPLGASWDHGYRNAGNKPHYGSRQRPF